MRDMIQRSKQRGFTIVELLIVIVIIGILAAIVIVAYNGITQRGRDSQRLSDMKSIEKALELYHADNGGYPTCNNTVYNAGDALSVCSMDSIKNSLVPKYIAKLPVDPTNSGSDVYKYAVGYKKNTATTFNDYKTDNYITGMKLESVSTVVGGWTTPPYYTYLGGSNN